MKSQPNARARRSAQHLPKHKRNPSVPRELAVFLCLPDSVGSLLDYEWTEPVRFESPVVPPVVTQPKPTLAEYLLADDEALRAFTAGQQYLTDYFKATGKVASFLDCSGALSGGAL
jgi:hypothetical protein